MGRPPSARVDEAILKAALELFTKGGMAAVTFEDVARTARVSRPAIYRRYASPAALVAAALGRHRESREQGFSDWKEHSLEDIVAWLIANAPKEMLRPEARAMLRQIASLGDDGDDLKKQYWTQFVAPRRAAFAPILAKRRAAAGDPDILQDMFAGALMHRLLIDPRPLTERNLRTYLTRLLAALGLTRSA